jgi:translation initiation factor 5B
MTKKRQTNQDDYLSSLGGEDEVVAEESTSTLKPKKGGNKKNAKQPVTNAFALLNDDDDNESSSVNNEADNNSDDDDIPVTIAPKKGNQKKQNKKQQQKKVATPKDDDDDDDDIDIAPKKGNQKKQNKKNKNDDYLASLADEGDDNAVEETKVEQPQKQQQSTKKNKKNDQNDYLASLGEEEPTEEETPKQQPAKKQQQQDKKKKPSNTDYLTSLDEEEQSEVAEPVAEKPAAKQQPAKKQPAKKEEKKPAPKKEDKKKDDKKKAADNKKKAPAKPVNPKLAALKEAMQKKKEEEERLKQEEEERMKREEEAMKLMEEQKKQDAVDRKILQKQKKEEEKLKKKQKEKEERERRAQEALKMFQKQGLIAALEKPKASDKKDKKSAEEKPVEKKPVEKPAVVEEKTVEPEPEPADEGLDDWENYDLDADDSSAKKKEEEKKKEAQRLERKKKEQQKKEEEEEDESSKKNHSNEGLLRSPICCVLGHVDTGKTKLLDKIRNTNVQNGEAGGITQQIGATYVPMDAIKRQTKKLNELAKGKLQYNLPGLLIIDTPGHESFTNLRTRGSSLCDIAILVVDILHGLERQTLESLQLLRQRKCPFVVALNKIDTIYGWKALPNAPIKESLKNQPKHTMEQFEENVRKTIYLFNEQGFNAELYYKNKDVQNYISMVPTSAITGEGLPDLLALMTQMTQKHMTKKITLQSKFECTILEVKVVDGYGTTIDIILSNGLIREGDKIVVCTLNGPVVTQIRALLTPQPMRELRVKGEYVHHKEITASMGIKISAPDLDGCVPGSQVFLVKPEDDIEELKEEVMGDLNAMLARISKSGTGVCVQSSTLGSLEALLEFLHSENIPVSGINIGPVHKKDIVRTSVMLEHNPEYAVMLAFDVPVTREAEQEAQKTGVTVFKADIIYHLFDSFIAHQKKVRDEKIVQTEREVVWPCILKISEQNVFRQKDPITVGVDVVEGVLRLGTPLIIPTKDNLAIGRVIGIQHQKQSIKEAERGRSVAIQIDAGKTITYGRHFDHTDLLYSKVTRNSIDLLKELFPTELKNNHDLLVLLVKLKKIFKIQ